MAVYGRTGVQDGEQVKLRVVFTDAEDNFVDSTALPSVYIYDDTVDTDTIDAEILAATYTSALAGPLVPTRIDTGFYELVYTVPVGGAEGTWHDVWLGGINSTDFSQVLNFMVINGADISEQKLLDNELIIVELQSTIASYTGLHLAADTQLSFITTLNPFYASTDLVRMEIGPWLDFIPDATLAMMIHWSSKEANFIQGARGKSTQRLQFARAKFVSYDAVLRALNLPGSSSYQPGGLPGASKRLGDLQITNGGGAQVARTASGMDVETLGYFRKLRDEWHRIVNAGGNIMPGQSLGFEIGVKGQYDPDKRLGGRLWADPNCHPYKVPATNAKVQFPGTRKGKFYFVQAPVTGGESDEV